MGMGMAVCSFATLIGPPINGALVTKYHSFMPAANCSGAFVILGTLVVLITKRLKGGGMFSRQ